MSKGPLIGVKDVPPGGKVLESDFQEALRRALNAPGRATRVWRQNAGKVEVRGVGGRSRGYVQGAPEGAGDLVGYAGPWGLHLEVEVKVDAPHAPPQVAWMAMLERSGAVYALVRYDHGLSLADNVSAGVTRVDAAVDARVRALRSEMLGGEVRDAA